MADCGDVLDVVWAVLNDYPRLAEAVPNLVENEVVRRLDGGGARLRQVRRDSVGHMMPGAAGPKPMARRYGLLRHL